MNVCYFKRKILTKPLLYHYKLNIPRADLNTTLSSFMIYPSITSYQSSRTALISIDCKYDKQYCYNNE
ncbi:MAG TPA: hypothetical protein VLG50_07665 [Candidatus Saccharimonadales bacterium]|nr:hypothetical protein [Candidatus Saccharimonadales bacterium]